MSDLASNSTGACAGRRDRNIVMFAPQPFPAGHPRHSGNSHSGVREPGVEHSSSNPLYSNPGDSSSLHRPHRAEQRRGSCLGEAVTSDANLLGSKTANRRMWWRWMRRTYGMRLREGWKTNDPHRQAAVAPSASSPTWRHARCEGDQQGSVMVVFPCVGEMLHPLSSWAHLVFSLQCWVSQFHLQRQRVIALTGLCTFQGVRNPGRDTGSWRTLTRVERWHRLTMAVCMCMSAVSGIERMGTGEEKKVEGHSAALRCRANTCFDELAKNGWGSGPVLLRTSFVGILLPSHPFKLNPTLTLVVIDPVEGTWRCKGCCHHASYDCEGSGAGSRHRGGSGRGGEGEGVVGLTS
ncbi:hypothetical protein FA15DRAFT_660963 [Coprinopsis marcescibilis]|uniref:Uncharacterized protein n=1 Tax=Coprinopsis marcescibilis TaxID=230819 RepID=A0A5C3KDC4_COPMA|nr:hypothetical protein FA15DRAFT_660963 [Coprinopsis marcescibilis]